jgi:hypothetical protein
MPFNFTRNPVQVKVPKVLVLNFRPMVVPQEWKDTNSLVKEYIDAMIQVSHKILVYKIVADLEIPHYPLLTDGRQYNDTTWTQALADDKAALRDPHGNYMLADYQHILDDYKILQAIQINKIDEVWMFGGPYFGFYESRMVGKGAFWCNAPAIEQNGRRFVLMGFNYQRTAHEMMHSFGHRAESILTKRYNSQDFFNDLYRQLPTPPPKNEFEQWLLQYGTVHRAPGGADYSQNEFTWATALKTEWWPMIIDPNKVP